MQRFWTATGVSETEGGGFCVTLDGRPIALPGEGRLRLPSRRLAEAVAAEWAEVGERFEPRELPLTQLAATAYHRIAPNPAPTVEAIARYAESELLCYRAEHPESLIRREEEAWQPWLAWAERRFAAPLHISRGLGFIAQPEASLAALRAAVGAFDAAGLAALGVIVPALGSLILGLAVMEGALAPAAAQDLAELDALYQEELWGSDPLARERRARILGEIETALRFFILARPGRDGGEG